MIFLARKAHRMVASYMYMYSYIATHLNMLVECRKCSNWYMPWVFNNPGHIRLKSGLVGQQYLPSFNTDVADH